MKIQDLMTTKVRTCGPTDTLSTAAQAMWESDCGSLPVVDGQGRVVGMVTDRDICMSAHLRGAPLWALSVTDAMAKVVYACKPTDKLSTCADLMAEHQLRRIPVIDEGGVLVGLITYGDLMQVTQGKRKKKSSLSAKDVVEVMSTVTSARPREVVGRLVIEVHRAAKPEDAGTLKPKPRAAKTATAPSPKPAKDKKARAGK